MKLCHRLRVHLLVQSSHFYQLPLQVWIRKPYLSLLANFIARGVRSSTALRFLLAISFLRGLESTLSPALEGTQKWPFEELIENLLARFRLPWCFRKLQNR